MQQATTLEAVLTRDRTVVLGGLAALTVLAWGYTIYLASDMMGVGMGAASMTIGSDGVAMPQLQPWGTVDFVLMFAMWAVMMTAMMLPSGAPMILVFAKINRKRRDQQKPFISTSVFLGGYLIVWGGFALTATLAQWGLHAATLISPMMVGTSPILGGTLLLAAGVFQWSRIKYVCVTQCRSPLSFLMSEWREGAVDHSGPVGVHYIEFHLAGRAEIEGDLAPVGRHYRPVAGLSYTTEGRIPGC